MVRYPQSNRGALLTIRLLGQFHIDSDGLPISLDSRPAQSLLAYLLMRPGQAVRREMLSGMLWPEASESNAKNSLRQAIWRARKSLEPGKPYLIVNDLTVAFDATAEYWLDVEQMNGELSQSTPIEQLEQVVGLYAGDLLPGFYDDWVVLEREHVHARFEQHMTLLLYKLEQAQRWTSLLTWSERWIALGSAPEPAYRGVMTAHAAEGDLAGMARAYARCQQAMMDTLGLEPGALTSALFEKLKTGQPVASTPAYQPSLVQSVKSDSKPAIGQPPYKGLHYYTAADWRHFFGRDELIRALYGRITGGERFLAVVGASGSGKSSIVRAGLAPVLGKEQVTENRADKQDQWNVVLITPTSRPNEALDRALQALRSPGAIAHSIASDSRASSGAGVRKALIVDQFEELFTLCHSESERTAFIDDLIALTHMGHGESAAVVVTLRADFYAQCGQYPALRALLAEHQLYLGPMSARELREAIEGPATAGGWTLEPGLVELILRDVGNEPGALPLLSHALLETWRRRRGRAMLIESYARSGGVHGAIARTAESVFQRQLTPDQQRIARNVFIRLTALGEGTMATRRLVAPAELFSTSQDPVLVNRVLETLADARLITIDDDSIEIAHEALILNWPTLQTWLADDRADILLHRHLTDTAQEWNAFDRNQSELYRGTRLTQTMEWVERRQPDLSTLEQEFIDASRAYAEETEKTRRQQEEKELRAALDLAQAQQRQAETARQLADDRVRSFDRLRRRNLYLTAALVAALIMAGIAFFLREQVERTAETARLNAERAETESQIAFSRELAAASAANLTGDTELSLLLALAAVSSAEDAGLPPPREAVEALHAASAASRLRASYETGFNADFSPDGLLLAHSGPGSTAIVREFPSGREIRRLDGHSGDLFGVNVIFDETQSRLLTASADGTAILWDAETGAEIIRLGAHDAAITDATLSGDGKWAATSGDDDTARVWDLQTGQEWLRLPVVGTSGVALDPEASRLAIARDTPEDSRISIWELATGKEVLNLSGHDRGSGDVIYSRDGTRIFSSGFDGTVKIWDAETGTLKSVLNDMSPVYSLALSPDGQLIALGSVNGDASLWNLQSEEVVHRFSGHGGWVTSVAFSSDGRYLTTSGADGKTLVWDLSEEAAAEWLALTGHDSVVYSVDFSSDGKLIATSSWDGTARIWDATDGNLLMDLAGAGDEMARAVFMPDTEDVITADYGGVVRIWDRVTGNLKEEIAAHSRGDMDVAISPDGTLLGTAGADGYGRLWSISSGELLHELVGHQDVVGRVSFNGDGSLYATASWDGTARVWDVQHGHLLMILAGGPSNVNSVDFSPDGRLVATAHEDGVARIWDLSRQSVNGLVQSSMTLSGHNSAVWDAVFSPDSKTLATIGFDGVVKLWDVSSGNEILTLPGDSYGPDLEFSPDGTLLAATGGDGVVRIYVLPLDMLVGIAQARLTRNFTDAECTKYLRTETCPDISWGN